VYGINLYELDYYPSEEQRNVITESNSKVEEINESEIKLKFRSLNQNLRIYFKDLDYAYELEPGFSDVQ
jgi:hypothetical protein